MTIQTFAAGQTLTASQMNTLQASDFNFTKNVQTGTNYTLIATDRGKLLEFSNSGAITLTIPTNSAVSFEVGDRVDVLLTSTGSLTIAGASGVSVAAEGGITTISSQWTRVTLIKRTTDDWVITGGSGEVQTAEIQDGAITEVKLATGAVTSDKILNGTIVNADISASAVIALSKLATGTSGHVVVHNSSGVPTSTAISGDITIDSTGNVQIAADKIVNADINASAAIAYSKLNLANSITTTDLASGAPRAGFRSSQNQQTGTTYTMALSDLGSLVELSNASSITVTIPLESSVAFAIGDRIDLLQTNTGQVTVVGAVGVTLNAYDNQYKLNGRWAAGTIIKRAANTWVLIGNITS
jgi:urease beta subunit